ncbi:MAG: RCC1 domain-containing protein, partial [Gemmatimonadales bacterium]
MSKADRTTGGRWRRGITAASSLALLFGSTTVLVSQSAAFADANELYGWGLNVVGQLGNGGTTNSVTPGKVQLPAGVVATAAATGGDHSLAIGSDGNLYAWGYNSNGQLGNGTAANSSTPVVVQLPAGVTATSISAGATHSLAVGSDGNVYAWGYNGYGQLGDGTLSYSALPLKVGLPAGTVATAVAAGANYSMALTSTGLVYGWGDGTAGVLCDGKFTSPVKNPQQATVSGIAAIAAGGFHSLFLTTAGALFACGYNAFGELGNGATTNAATRVRVSMPTGVNTVSMAAGEYHSLAIGSDGRTYAWGDNSNGQLGNGTTTNSSTPLAVSVPAGVTFSSLAAGAVHSLAIGSDGNAYGWGYNALGELGNGTTADAHTPVQVGISPVAKPPVAIVSGNTSDHSMSIAPPTPASTTTTLA